MTKADLAFKNAQRVLGPIRCHYSIPRKTWTLDQKPCFRFDILRAAVTEMKRQEAIA